MAKLRTPIPREIAVEVEFEHNRTCCVCRQSGRPTQIHHIDDDPSHHAPANLAVLCLDCHDQTQIRGGFARKLGPDLVRRFRDDWTAAILRGRIETEKLLAAQAIALPGLKRSFVDPDFTRGENPELADYLDSLPELLIATSRSVENDWDSGVTTKMVDASVEVGAILERIWVRLARFYPEGHFSDDPGSFLSEHLDQQLRWYRKLIEPDGPGTGGTIIRVLIGGEYMSASGKAVEDIAVALLGMACNTEEVEHWRTRWSEALHRSSTPE